MIVKYVIFRHYASRTTPSSSHFCSPLPRASRGTQAVERISSFAFRVSSLQSISPLPAISSALFLCSPNSQTFQPCKPQTPCQGSTTYELPRIPLSSRLLYFQSLTHCPICKFFVFIPLQQYPGVVGVPPFSLFYFPPVLHWSPITNLNQP